MLPAKPVVVCLRWSDARERRKRNGQGEGPNEHYQLQICSRRESSTHVYCYSLPKEKRGERTSLILELIS
jgi:hypothetical protein